MVVCLSILPGNVRQHVWCVTLATACDSLREAAANPRIQVQGQRSIQDANPKYLELGLCIAGRALIHRNISKITRKHFILLQTFTVSVRELNVENKIPT